MASAADFRRQGMGSAAVLITGSLIWFGTGLDPIWPLMWWAPLPVLLFATRASWWGAGLVAGLGWLLGFLNMWHYFHSVINIPMPILLLIYASQAVAFALAVLLYRALLLRNAYVSALLVLPAAWVSFEYLLNITSAHGSAGNLAYSQLGCLPYLQLASLTGPWGMSFLLLLFPTAIAIGLRFRSTEPRRALQIVGVPVGLIVLVLVFGTLRLEQPIAGVRVQVGLIASDPPGSPPVADEGGPTAKLFKAYADKAVALAAQGASVIVLPEKLGVAVNPDAQETDAFFQSLADGTKASIVVGLIHVSSPKAYNEARIYMPEAQVASYAKHHMLPSFESNLEPGRTLTLLPQSSGTWGLEICKDMDFTSPSREYGSAGAGLMLVPAWDFGLDRIWHGHMAVMRGVEDGFNIVRAAKEGYLTVSDNRGRILAETTSDSAPFATLLASVPTAHETTLYLVFGDWFAWLAMTLLAFAISRCLTHSRQEGRNT